MQRQNRVLTSTTNFYLTDTDTKSVLSKNSNVDLSLRSGDQTRINAINETTKILLQKNFKPSVRRESDGNRLTGKYYVLRNWKQAILEKHRGKFRHGVLLLHDNTPVHKTPIASSMASMKSTTPSTVQI